MRSKSQGEEILGYLQRGNTLTALEALSLFGCNRLAARINELKNKGHDIGKETVKTPRGARIASYSLAWRTTLF